MRTAPIPNMAAIPGMNPGLFILGGGGAGGGSGAGGGKGKSGKQGANGKNGGKDAQGGGKDALCSGAAGLDGGGCPRHHGGKSSGKASKGDPVDVVTGRVFTSPAIDVAFPGPLPLRITRTYSSHARERDAGLGHGWACSLSFSIDLTRRTLRVWTTNGTLVEIERMEDGGAALGPDGWIIVRSGDTYVLDDGEGCFYVFAHQVEETLYLTAVKDVHGNTISLAYEGTSLVEVQDSAGRTIRVRRAQDGRIAAWEARNAVERGQWVTLHSYRYDAEGDLVEATDAEGFITRFTYQDHLLTSTSSPEGFTFHFIYDDAGRCVETWGDHPDPRRLGLAAGAPETLADGATPARGIFHTRLHYGEDGYSEAVDSVTAHRYFGNELGKLDKAVTGGAVISRAYDENGHLLSYTDALGATTTWTRDARGRPLVITDPLGRTTTIERDPDGHIRKVIDPEGGVTETLRGPRSLRWTDPIGAAFSITIDDRGLVTQTVAPNGARTIYEHDAQGNVVKKTDALGASWQWVYDPLGRCIQETDPLGHSESYVHDARGLRVATRRADGSVVRYRRDGHGDLVEIIHEDGQRTWFEMVCAGRTGVIHRPNGEVDTFHYDREGRMVEARNGRGDVYLMEYDVAGMLVRERTFTGLEKRYSHDLNGQVISEELSTGEKTEFKYDAAGQLVERTLADGSSEVFKYNDRGEIIAAATGAGTFDYVRNAIGWIIEERQTVAGETSVVRTELDGVGNAVRTSSSLGHSIDYNRDILGRVREMTLDGADRLTLSYDALGREVERTLPGGGCVMHSYDSLGRLSLQAVRSPGAAVMGGPGAPGWVGARPPGTTVYKAFRYAPSSDLAEIWDDARGRALFEHDPAGQLTRRTRERGREERYRYDTAGNLHEEGAAARAYGPGNRLESCGDTELLWDEAGRLIEARSASSGATHYTWNALGLLESIRRPDGTVLTYTYDPFARRMRKRVFQRGLDGRDVEIASTRFVWSGAELVHEIRCRASGSGDPIVEERTYCFDERSSAPLAQRARLQGEETSAGPAWQYYLNDVTGAPDRLIGPRGEVLGELSRDPWGKVESGGDMTPLRFRGQYEDEETGLVYNRHRYYDPSIGRYISEDPAGLDGGFNGYDYAANSPLRFADPSGLMPFSAIKNKNGTTDGKDYTDPTNRRGLEPDIQGKSAKERKSAPHSTDPAIEEAVKNAQKKIGVSQTGDTSCAEVDALHKMAKDCRKDLVAKNGGKAVSNEAVRAELQRRFKNGATIETTNKSGEGMAPCPLCAQIFRELGIHPANIGDDARGGVIGPNNKTDTKVNKMGRWDGTVTQASEPTHDRKTTIATSPSSTPPFAGT